MPPTPPEERANTPEADGRGPLATVAREWARLGAIGFGGPPTHIVLLRQLCVQRRGWIPAEEFEDAIAACNLLPGPSSTQLAICCAGRVAGRPGALVGGAGFILPGLTTILVLAALFLSSSPPDWVRAAGAGGGAAVAAVAVRAAMDLAAPSFSRAARTGARARWLAYLSAGAVSSALVGPWLVLVLLACGGAEVLVRRGRSGPIALAALPHPAWLGSLSWTALMQADAVSHYHWMTGAQFLDAVVLGQVTPGPVVGTVAAVGYAAGGLGAALLAALIAFTPSFLFVLAGRKRFDRLRGNPTAPAFLEGSRAGGDRRHPRLIGPPGRRAGRDVAVRAARRGGGGAPGGRRSIVAVLLATAVLGELALVAGARIPG